MDINYIEVVGFIAGFITTFASLPQVLKVYKGNHVEGLSLPYFIMLSSGVFLWLIYGILINSLTMIIPNVITFIFVMMIIYKIVSIGHKNEH